MELVYQSGWNNQERSANFCAFVLDKMHYQLDPVNRPYENLVELFK